ncbi:hypothetical protein, partial [Enterococcus casseliflavus]|uniref:hypothetical protein n=1 Tax=Enterococcus casseliflavus TaxID=37734 RepID=UPI003D118316
DEPVFNTVRPVVVAPGGTETVSVPTEPAMAYTIEVDDEEQGALEPQVATDACELEPAIPWAEVEPICIGDEMALRVRLGNEAEPGS